MKKKGGRETGEERERRTRDRGKKERYMYMHCYIVHVHSYPLMFRKYGLQLTSVYVLFAINTWTLWCW